MHVLVQQAAPVLVPVLRVDVVLLGVRQIVHVDVMEQEEMHVLVQQIVHVQMMMMMVMMVMTRQLQMLCHWMVWLLVPLH